MNHPSKILVVDDEKSILEFFEVLLENEGYEVELDSNPLNAIQKIKEGTYDLVITDLSMPEATGMDVLDCAQKYSPESVVVIITAYATAENAVEAMKTGAYDYVMKPFKIDHIKKTIRNAIEKIELKKENKRLREEFLQNKGLERFIGKSQAMEKVYQVIRRVATSHSGVLLYGESGTGKELAARSIHELSQQKDGPFVSINCGAIPENLIESEFFGYEKGAFSGAESSKPGLFEAANGGTLFLDEIGELPFHLQVKLLKVLQDREVRRLGSTESTSIQVRVVAATNKNLEEEVKNKNFREDLFYRLNIIQIEMPALRDRKEDIPRLIDFFLRRSCEESQREDLRVDPSAMTVLMEYDYPGNVRELENIIEQCVALESTDFIRMETLPKKITNIENVDRVELNEFPESGVDLEKVLGSYEKKLLERALEASGGIRKRAAELLNISFRSIRYRLQKHKLD